MLTYISKKKLNSSPHSSLYMVQLKHDYVTEKKKNNQEVTGQGAVKSKDREVTLLDSSRLLLFKISITFHTSIF